MKCKPQGVHNQPLDELCFRHTVAGNDVLRADTGSHCSAKNKKQNQTGESFESQPLHCLLILIHVQYILLSYYWFSRTQMARYFELASPYRMMNDPKSEGEVAIPAGAAQSVSIPMAKCVTLLPSPRLMTQSFIMFQVLHQRRCEFATLKCES